MIFQLKKPTPLETRALIEESKKYPFSYSETGSTKGLFPKGYDHDKSNIILGKGEKIKYAAIEAVKNWNFFPDKWAFVFPESGSLKKGELVVLNFKIFGIWWKSVSKIVYTINTPNQFGFAYGTLTNHVEKGEEIFMIETAPDGTVFYKIEAFSKPNFWMVRLGYPLARYMQRRFVKESQEKMKRLVKNTESSHE